MKAESKLSRVILVSPWFLLIFLVIPATVILSIRLHVQLPMAGSRPLLINNICFTFLVACRLVRYLSRLGRAIRYGSAYCRPREGVTLALPTSDLRALLGEAGYTIDADGGYAEKRDLGYIGTVVLYGGLLIALATGSWSNLRQFSGVLLDGIGPATDLNKVETYRGINKGPLAAMPVSLPRMQIINQYMPDSTYPRGATEVALISEDGKIQKKLLRPKDPVSIGDYDIYMAKLVFQPQIVIKTKDSTTLFDSMVRLDPLVEKRGEFSFYGPYIGTGLVGGVYYNPDKSRLMVVITRGDKRVVTDMVFQVDQQAEKEGYLLSCAKMGQWSEIHVIHRRHMGLLVVGGVITIIGLFLRIAIRPQRVWLEESAEGCTIRVSGEETKKLLKVD